MQKIWWKEAIGYQVYPRSFMDSNNDGIGDLAGVTKRLDYIKSLGIDVIWICPMYKSPNDDNGYDISDYLDIMDEFGTMGDFDTLLTETHKRGMKLIIDLVINHTSDEHEWFVESKSSVDSEKRDWYIWRKGKENQEPNNWESIFAGSAWEFDENSKEYFLHLFSKKQPDLNWENKEMRYKIYEMINWWLEKGIDGFRVDAISHIKKEKGLLDIKDNQYNKNFKYKPCFEKMMNVNGIQKYLSELKKETFDKFDIMTVGEANGVTTNDCLDWVGFDEGKFNMIFQFGHINLWNENIEDNFDVKKYKKEMQKWQDALHGKGWNGLFIENHDVTRVVSTWGNDTTYLTESAKCLGLSYFMQQGTPFIYQGQEIGMTNIELSGIDDFNDVGTKNNYKKMTEEKGFSKEKALKIMNASSRDNSRTTMQWDSSKNGGFSESDSTWFHTNPNYKTINVELQEKDSNSVLNFYKEMIKLKKENETLIYGKCNLVMPNSKKIYAYERVLNDSVYLIMCNLSDDTSKFVSDYSLSSKNIVLSNYKYKEHNLVKSTYLKPWECRLYKLS